MRKGAFNRLSIVIVTLSMVSVVPVAYFHYKSEAPHAYVCSSSSSEASGLACYPIGKSEYPDSYRYYVDNDTLHVSRVIGNQPGLYFENSYMYINYKLLMRSINNPNTNYTTDTDKITNEHIAFNKIKNMLPSELKYIEDAYIVKSIEYTITRCIVIPLAILAILYILRGLTKFIIHGRDKEANT